MQLPIDRHSSKPIYIQIRDRMRRLIQSGSLQPGDKLPSIRRLARTIQVSPLTVIEAYGLLEGDNLIQSRPGSGYFVNAISPKLTASPFAPAQTVIIQDQEAGGFCQQFVASLQVQAQGGVIDFSSGFPRPWGLEDLQKIARRAISQASDSLFNYGFPQGQPLLQQQIAQLLVQQGLDISPQDLIITNGSQQALTLAMQHYLQPGDWVIVEAPTFHGAIALLENIGARIIGIPMTQTGMNLELLEQYLRSHRPKLIYTISTLHNPTGLTTPQSHRQQLLELASRYDCPILEDNAYEGLNFEPVPPPIKAIDQNHLVTYVGTFTKSLIPGLRVGYMVVTGANREAMLKQKLLHDFHVSTVSQAIVSEYLASGRYRRHLQQLRSYHFQSRNVMLQALERSFPPEASWTVPQGGLFLWVHLPDWISVPALCKAAFAQGVLIANGAAFFPGHKGYSALRLNYSHSLEEIEVGMARVGRLVGEMRLVSLAERGKVGID
ncbi:MAG: PLP-dependent aminotransferase family protein [Leptolyngbya sp. IPPAS B-1204]|nr:PLP-dependent aminotransferase family protein [Elainella sp. C42_A2020_010]RNJ65776.1 MAG: PLP-dependent aminotransferase family protein [Leptolyngbya sp. IPPAS B-1204]